MSGVLAGSARDWKARLIAGKLGPHGIGIDDFARGPVRSPLSAKVLFADRRFATASRPGQPADRRGRPTGGHHPAGGARRVSRCN